MTNSRLKLTHQRVHKSTAINNNVLENEEIYNSVGNVDLQAKWPCARKVVNKRGITYYYVLQDFSGNLYHPTKNSIVKPIHLRELGKQHWTLKRVKQFTFESYLSFLKNKNEIFYQNAYRSLI